MTVLLEVRGLGKSFGGLQALKDVSFAVLEREIFAVIGPNGAGKTTLFNCLAGALPLSCGRVALQGRRIDQLRPHAICDLGVARTFQIVKPFTGMSVLENVQVAALCRHTSVSQARAAAMAALGELDLADRAHRDAGELTVAELRSLEIARALATEPKLLLLDEMLAGLTGVEAHSLCEKILQLPERGIAVIVVEHSVPIISTLCSRAVALDFGRVLASGPTRQVIEDEQVQSAYLGSAPA